MSSAKKKTSKGTKKSKADIAAAAAIQAAADDKASTTETPAKEADKTKKRKPRTAAAKKPSALDAAARVLSEKGEPMSCGEMIEAMAAQGYWHSPAGKTPAATLYTVVTMLPKVA